MFSPSLFQFLSKYVQIQIDTFYCNITINGNDFAYVYCSSFSCSSLRPVSMNKHNYWRDALIPVFFQFSLCISTFNCLQLWFRSMTQTLVLWHRTQDWDQHHQSIPCQKIPLHTDTNACHHSPSDISRDHHCHPRMLNRWGIEHADRHTTTSQ